MPCRLSCGEPWPEHRSSKPQLLPASCTEPSSRLLSFQLPAHVSRQRSKGALGPAGQPGRAAVFCAPGRLPRVTEERREGENWQADFWKSLPSTQQPIPTTPARRAKGTALPPPPAPPCHPKHHSCTDHKNALVHEANRC